MAYARLIIPAPQRTNGVETKLAHVLLCLLNYVSFTLCLLLRVVCPVPFITLLFRDIAVEQFY